MLDLQGSVSWKGQNPLSRKPILRQFAGTGQEAAFLAACSLLRVSKVASGGFPCAE